jgi:hypothetical protein
LSPPANSGSIPAAAPEPSTPREPGDLSVDPGDALPDRPPAISRGRPGEDETAPDALLKAPESASRAADDFFDSLARRVEGER